MCSILRGHLCHSFLAQVGPLLGFPLLLFQPCLIQLYMSNSESSTKPFVLKMKTNQIRVCQSCRKDYNGPNDTMGLLVARAERRLVSNLHTGTEFLGRESNSHYHLHMECLKPAQPSFSGDQLVILDEVKGKLTTFQKVYLITCIQVPQQSLWNRIIQLCRHILPSLHPHSFMLLNPH